MTDILIKIPQNFSPTKFFEKATDNENLVYLGIHINYPKLYYQEKYNCAWFLINASSLSLLVEEDTLLGYIYWGASDEREEHHYLNFVIIINEGRLFLSTICNYEERKSKNYYKVLKSMTSSNSAEACDNPKKLEEFLRSLVLMGCEDHLSGGDGIEGEIRTTGFCCKLNIKYPLKMFRQTLSDVNSMSADSKDDNCFLEFDHKNIIYCEDFRCERLHGNNMGEMVKFYSCDISVVVLIRENNQVFAIDTLGQGIKDEDKVKIIDVLEKINWDISEFGIRSPEQQHHKSLKSPISPRTYFCYEDLLKLREGDPRVWYSGIARHCSVKPIIVDSNNINKQQISNDGKYLLFPKKDSRVYCAPEGYYIGLKINRIPPPRYYVGEPYVAFPCCYKHPQNLPGTLYYKYIISGTDDEFKRKVSEKYFREVKKTIVNRGFRGVVYSPIREIVNNPRLMRYRVEDWKKELGVDINVPRITQEEESVCFKNFAYLGYRDPRTLMQYCRTVPDHDIRITYHIFSVRLEANIVVFVRDKNKIRMYNPIYFKSQFDNNVYIIAYDEGFEILR